MKQSKKFLFQPAKPSRKRAKLEVVELATIQHQGKEKKAAAAEVLMCLLQKPKVH